MALSWNINNCKDTELLKSDAEWYKTETIIFATMGIDMHEITEENATEFYARLKLISSVQGGLWYTAGFGWEEPTIEDVQRRIGLETNAYSNNTFRQWVKRITMAHSKTTSENRMLAAYYSAKAEVETINERVTI